VLVDTGLGLLDVAVPLRRLGPGFLAAMHPRLDANETAARQVERLGFSREDVRDVLLTHLDPDHAGDFPIFRTPASMCSPPSTGVATSQSELAPSDGTGLYSGRTGLGSCSTTQRPRWYGLEASTSSESFRPS